MSPCRRPCLFICLSAALVWGWLAVPVFADGGRPNVLLIVADDQGFGDVAYNGNPKIDTPHLDRLAASGIRLEQFHVCPASATSLASLLTGRYHYRTGVSGDTPGEEVMHGHEITLGEVFRGAGYATGCFGKWHNGSNWPQNAGGQGFDHFVGACLNRWPRGFDAELERDGRPHPTRGWITDALTDEVLAFLTDQATAKKPFFCYLPLGAPTDPAEAPAALLEKYRSREGIDPETAAVYARIESIDANVGRLIAWLDSRGLREETIVWYFSATGPDVSPTEKKPRHNAFLRGARDSVHEGGVRVPGIFSWPAQVPPDSRFRRITAHLDVLPTLIDLCGIDPPKLPWIDGMSLRAALLSGGKPDRWPNRLIFTSWTPPSFDTPNASVAVRTDRWLALRDPNWRRGELSPLHSGWELYDLDADPHESTDLAGDYPYLLSDMRADYSRWIDETTDDGIGRIPTELGHPEWPVVTLSAAGAQVSAGWKVADRGEHSPLTGWTDPKESARWPVKVKGEGGRFAVEIVYSLPGANAPCSMKLEIGGKELPFTATTATDGWQTLPIGEIDLVPGESEVVLRPVKITGQAVEVKAVVLRGL